VGAWREFALRKDVLNTAVGFMIGGALTSIVNSLVNDMLTPLIAAAWHGSQSSLDGAFVVLKRSSGSNATYTTIAEAATDGAITLNYGRFLSACLDFAIMSLIIFLLFRLIRRLQATASNAVNQAAQQVATQKL
jgi:large conductance mechanosensitive channel